MSELHPEMILFQVRDDAGPFELLGGHFACNGVPWIGPAVASPVALYLLKIGRHDHTRRGAFAGSLFTLRDRNYDDGLCTCEAADLPAPARAALDRWRMLPLKEVVIIPKSTVSLVKTSRWNNSIVVRAGPDKFAITTSLRRLFAKPRALAAMGWTLNLPLLPTATPVHDSRTDGQRAAAEVPLWEKILGLVGGILFLIAYIAWRTRR